MIAICGQPLVGEDCYDRTRLSYHGVCESRRNRNEHPPDDSLEKFFAFALDERLDDSTIHLRNAHADECSQHKEKTVANQQSCLFTLPRRNDNFKQA